jgi:hypothetical protein
MHNLRDLWFDGRYPLFVGFFTGRPPILAVALRTWTCTLDKPAEASGLSAGSGTRHPSRADLYKLVIEDLGASGKFISVADDGRVPDVAFATGKRRVGQRGRIDGIAQDPEQTRLGQYSKSLRNLNSKKLTCSPSSSERCNFRLARNPSSSH